MNEWNLSQVATVQGSDMTILQWICIDLLVKDDGLRKVQFILVFPFCDKNGRGRRDRVESDRQSVR